MFESLAFRLFFCVASSAPEAPARASTALSSRFAVGLVDRFEFPALAGAQPQLADDLFAGRLVQLFERLGWPYRCVPPHRWPAGFGHGARDFAVGEAPSHGALRPRRVRSPAGRLHGPPGFCHGAFQLAGEDAPRGVRRCAGLGQQLFRFVAGRCGISRQGEQQGAEEKQDMFHTEMFLELLVVKDVVVILCGGLTQRLGRVVASICSRSGPACRPCGCGIR